MENKEENLKKIVDFIIENSTVITIIGFIIILYAIIKTIVILSNLFIKIRKYGYKKVFRKRPSFVYGFIKSFNELEQKNAE